jgi:hypothetical protein
VRNALVRVATLRARIEHLGLRKPAHTISEPDPVAAHSRLRLDDAFGLQFITADHDCKPWV